MTGGLPEGTVTFVFTDIEGSTHLAGQLGDAGWVELLEAHNGVLRKAFGAHRGVEVKTDGDAFFVIFERATDGVAAVVEAQRALESHPWPDGQVLRVRVGVHTGEAIVRDGDYVGHHVHRAARICDAGHGGQTLVSRTTADLVTDSLPEGVTLSDLGPHRLKDLGSPEHLFGVQVPDLQCDFPPLRTLEGRPNNLPVQRSTFIGRSKEIARVRKLLDAHPLVTLAGVGGAGKTRLALQVGAEELDRQRDGVFFVDFASLSDPDLVARTVADALGLSSGTGIPAGSPGSTSNLLVPSLARRRCLLILDNCEHLLDACAELADQILAACPDVRVLATSREPLEVEGEQVHRVPSLSLPGERSDEGRSEAVELFADRAAAARSDFELTAEHASAVDQICRRLDGIPLAIEFAAARVTHLTPQVIAERLDDRFRLLTGGRRRVRRQQTLEATLDWSHDLLDTDQQKLLRRLAVFSGGFELPMAEEVCSGDGIERSAVLDLLASLVDKSLVAAETGDGTPRYRLLETVRGYAETKLDAAGEAEALRSRHRDAYLDWLESMAWEDLYFDVDLVDAQIREHSNLRSAMEWSQAQGRRDLVGRLAARGIVLWGPVVGYGEEGYRWLSWALADPDALDRAERAACLVALAGAAGTLGKLELETHAARAIELGREALGSLVVSAFGWRAMGASVRYVITGDPEAARDARSFAEEEVRAAGALGDLWPALALTNHGDTAMILGDLVAAERSYTAASEGTGGRIHAFQDFLSSQLSVCRTTLGDPEGGLEAARQGLPDPSATTRSQLASHLAAALAEACLGTTADAATNLEAGIRIAETEGVLLDANACLMCAAVVAFETGDAATASRLLAAAVSAGHAPHMPIAFRTPADYALYRHYRPLVRAALGEEEARRCRDQGRAMTIEEGLAAARDIVQALRAAAVR